MNISELHAKSVEYRTWLKERKLEVASADWWYPYDILANFTHLEKLLGNSHADVFEGLAGMHVADIGAADGDNAFFLESLGAVVDVVDHPPTNFNALQGVRMLKDALKSSVSIHHVDLDTQFRLPRNDYKMALFLGILYHLKNPFYALEQLAQSAEYCVLSTKIARFSAPSGFEIKDVSLAYFLDTAEANNDPSNYWVFSETSLKRILRRTGWNVEAFTTVGDTKTSDPVRGDHDERAFCLLRSRHKYAG